MRLNVRLRYFLVHLAASAALVGLALAFVVFVWYPPAIAQIEGVFEIVLIMAGVDVCVGPLCTLVVASPKKTRTHLARDLAVIGAAQLLALGYALYTSCIARPAFIVYAEGQFVVSHAYQLTAQELAQAALPEFASPPWLGPVFVEAQVPDDPKVLDQITQSVLRGGPGIKDMPKYYRRWPFAGTDARRRAKPVSGLPENGALRPAALKLLQAREVPEADAAVLPIAGKLRGGTVVLRESDLAILGIVDVTI